MAENDCDAQAEDPQEVMRPSGADLVEAFRRMPAGELTIEHEPTRAPVRDVEL